MSRIFLNHNRIENKSNQNNQGQFIVIFVFFFSFFFFQQNLFAAPIDVGGYFRLGSGMNLKGGKQNCEDWAPDDVWYKMRLGFECGAYSEIYLSKSFLSEKENEAFFKTYATLIFERPGNSTYESGAVKFGEIYAEGGNFDNLKMSYWGGQRRIRWGNIYVLDSFPIAFEGVGAGIGRLVTSYGKWSAFFLSGYETPAAPAAINVGSPSVNTFHLQLEDYASVLNTKLSFWLAAGSSTAAKDLTSGKDYVATPGYVFYTKANTPLSNGYSELGLMYGTGILSGFQMGPALVQDCNDATNSDCTVSSSSRLRAYGSYNQEYSPTWSYQVALLFDSYDKGIKSKNKVNWASFGFQPIYYFTDHFQMTGGLGVSYANNESDNKGDRLQYRFTVGPQVTVGRNYWARPVIRAYYSYVSRNEASKELFGSKTTSANSLYKDELSAHSLGFLTEVWF